LSLDRNVITTGKKLTRSGLLPSTATSSDLEERGGKARSPGVSGQKIVKAVFKELSRFREGEITRLGLRRKLVPLRRRLKRLLQRHANNPVRAARALVTDPREYGAALWTLAKVEDLEPTNNAAERAIRKAVLWRKGSFGSASPAGSRFVERILTVCESLRTQERPVIVFSEGAIRSALAGTSHPTLVPAIS
jgi:transposase